MLKMVIYKPKTESSILADVRIRGVERHDHVTGLSVLRNSAGKGG